MCTFKFFRSSRKNEELNIEETEDNKFSDISFEKSTIGLIDKFKNKEQSKNFSGIFQSFLNFLKGLGVFVLIGILMGKEIGLVYAPINITEEIPIEENRLSSKTEILENEFEKLLEDIDRYEQQILILQKNKKTLTNETKLLDSEVQQANLQIQALDYQISSLSREIDKENERLMENSAEIAQRKLVIEELLAEEYVANQNSQIGKVLASKNLNDFSESLNYQLSLKTNIENQLKEIEKIKQILNSQNEELKNKKSDLEILLSLKQEQARILSAKKEEKEKLLALTQGTESKYQELLAQSQKTVEGLKSQIFSLRSGEELTFEQALEYAQYASEKTGVRTALILAVLDKESNFGKNNGKCNYQEAMNPKEIPFLMQITKELNTDPNLVPVSCPILSDGNYGGAIGPAQFLPSTWLEYRDLIQKITNRVPSPWNPQDAFLAAALYLKNNGADSQNYNNEKIAAAKYYGGGKWNYYLYSYGNRVMELAAFYEEQINNLNSKLILKNIETYLAFKDIKGLKKEKIIF